MGLGEREPLLARAATEWRPAGPCPLAMKGLYGHRQRDEGLSFPQKQAGTGQQALAGQAAPGAHLAQAFQHAVGHAQGAVARAQTDAGLVGAVIVRAAADAQAVTPGQLQAAPGGGLGVFAVIGLDGGEPAGQEAFDEGLQPAVRQTVAPSEERTPTASSGCRTSLGR